MRSSTDRPTCIADLMDERELQDMINAKYIRVQEHPNLPLRIYNYTETAMFDNTWNKATLACRGLIAHREGWIVARPWEKFFNYGQKATLIGSHDEVEITDKMDGSLGIGYPSEHAFNGWMIATRGSFTSDQAVWATHWLQETFPEWNPDPGYTPLFEIVYPENRIVLDYGNYEGLVLLGCVDVQDGHVYGPYEAAGILMWPGETTKVLPYRTMADFVSSPDASRPNAEGVVIRSGHRMVKIKQEDYIAAHSVVTGLSNRSVWKSLAEGFGVPEQASFMPDEFYRWLIQTAAALTDAKVAWQTEALLEFDRIYNNAYQLTAMLAGSGDARPTRKQFAALACKSPFSAALFKLYDLQSIEEMAWAAVRPVTFERPFNRSEATA